MNHSHQPVLLDEVIEYLPEKKTGVIVDCTLGGGGYSRRFLEEGFQVIAFEKDINRINDLEGKLSPEITVINDSYAALADQLFINGIAQVDAVVFDLGVSSFQLDDVSRGFSWKDASAQLDMRMDRRNPLTAAKVLNEYPLEKLATVFKEYGEEPKAKRIAAQIVKQRDISPLAISDNLLTILKQTYGWKLNKGVIARNFQAIRIEVNNELDDLKKALDQVCPLLTVGGRMIAVSFHSLEDRIVKHYLKDNAQGCTCPPSFPVCRCGNIPKYKILTRKPIIPTDAEIEQNVRSRSAKMRVGEKL